MNNVAYFEIQSDEPAKSVAFYSEIFGWKCIKEEHMPLEYWRIENAGINGAILKRPGPPPALEQGTNAFTCSVQVEDFDVTTKMIMDHGGQVAMPKFAVPNKCWQGYFLDTQGNIFGIFQVDEKAK